MNEILEQLIIMNEHLSQIEAYQSLIYGEIYKIKGNGIGDNISDVYEKLDEINAMLYSMDASL